MRTTTRQRREAIQDELYSKQAVNASELAVLLGVSEATVRRDLHALADEGKLELVHGGATVKRTLDFSFKSKVKRNIACKRTIARLASGLVGNGEQVFLAGGSTCCELAPFLNRKQDVVVLTNSTRLAMALDAPGLEVIMLGGQYRPDRMDMVGPLALAALDQMRGYKAFLGADGVSMDFGLTASDMEGAHLYRLAAKHAREIVLLIDHTKFSSPSLCKIVAWEDVTTVVTDIAPSPEWIAFFEKHDIALLYPEGAGGA